MTKTFSRNGLELVFYQKEGDEKYSFYLKDEPILTEHLLNSVKTKRVREDKIKYAVKGIFNLLFNGEMKQFVYDTENKEEITVGKAISAILFDYDILKNKQRLSSDEMSVLRKVKESLNKSNGEIEWLSGINLVDKRVLNLKKEETMRNPIIELSEMVQSTYGENIETKVVGKIGPDHEPKIFVEIILPDGNRYKGEGPNKKIAKQDAAKKALKDYTASVEEKATR